MTNTLPLHIEYLLRTHDCVTVPGLGAFIVSRRSAVFDRSAGLLLPPVREVLFNASIVHNDGVIANSIARREGLSFAQASEKLHHDAGDLYNRLREGETIDLGSVGSLSMGEENNVIFTPSADAETCARRLGLEPVDISHSTPVERVPEVAETTAEPKAERKFRTDKYYYIPVNKRLARYAAILAVIIAVAIPFFTFTPASAPSPDMASVVPVPKVERKVAKPAPAPKPAPQKAAPADRFYLIVGTFTLPEEVERFVARHSDEGFKLTVLKGERYTRVSIASSPERDELLPMLRDEKARSTFDGMWIWESKEAH